MFEIRQTTHLSYRLVRDSPYCSKEVIGIGALNEHLNGWCAGETTVVSIGPERGKYKTFGNVKAELTASDPFTEEWLFTAETRFGTVQFEVTHLLEEGKLVIIADRNDVAWIHKEYEPETPWTELTKLDVPHHFSSRLLILLPSFPFYRITLYDTKSGASLKVLFTAPAEL